MRHAIVRSLGLASLLAAALLGIVSVPAVAGANFDAFFAGLDKACTRSGEFEAFQISLAAKFVPGGDSQTPLALPAALPPPAIGGITHVELEDHVRVTVALDGSFRGLKLSKLEFYFGKENGIFGWAVEFAEPADRLRKTLGDAVKAGNKILAKDVEAGASTGFDLKNGRVALYCDFSN